MGPTGPIQIQDVKGPVTFTNQRRPVLGAHGPLALHETPYLVVRHVPGRWKHIMVSPVQYKMRGFNASTGQYEYWQTNNPSAGPPSGAALANKSIAAVVVNSFPTSE